MASGVPPMLREWWEWLAGSPGLRPWASSCLLSDLMCTANYTVLIVSLRETNRHLVRGEWESTTGCFYASLDECTH